MNQRLIWNFEFSAETTKIEFPEYPKESLKWEFRAFYPGDYIITLPCIDPALLNLKNYSAKSKDDIYFLFDDENYNIKTRREELLYKPLKEQSKYALGFDKKIILQSTSDLTDKSANIVQVKKELFIYKFKTSPKIKLELSKVEVNNQIYYGVCVEGRSKKLVEQISEVLIGKQPTNDYITFLKKTLES